MLLSSQQISASILHLYGQTFATGSEGGHQQQKTKKLFLGNEAERLAPDEARRRLRKLVWKHLWQESMYLLQNLMHQFWRDKKLARINALALQVKEMDKDQDEQLTVVELTSWIEKRQREQVMRGGHPQN